jgi:hypothetical protein
MKKRSVFLVAVLMILAVSVFAQTPNDFKIDLSRSGDAITITGYTGSATKVVIPAEIEGIPVRGIGGSAFRDNKNITAVIIPDTVTTIDNGASTASVGAFSDCSNLSSVTLSSNLAKIGSSAFARCSKLTSIVIPDSVTSIGDSAFSGTGLTSVAIPNSVTSIGDSAFAHCKNLTTINIPNGVKTIGNRTFGGCGFTAITIPNGVTAIGYEAFRECSSLVSISIPNSVKTIGNAAFFKCDKLSTVTVEEGAEIRFISGNYNVYSNFEGCGKLDVKSQLALKRAGYRGDF